MRRSQHQCLAVIAGGGHQRGNVAHSGTIDEVVGPFRPEQCRRRTLRLRDTTGGRVQIVEPAKLGQIGGKGRRSENLMGQRRCTTTTLVARHMERPHLCLTGSDQFSG